MNEIGLTAPARGEPLDPARHCLTHEIKAITYHHLKVEHILDGWLAEVIVRHLRSAEPRHRSFAAIGNNDSWGKAQICSSSGKWRRRQSIIQQVRT